MKKISVEKKQTKQNESKKSARLIFIWSFSQVNHAVGALNVKHTTIIPVWNINEDPFELKFISYIHWILCAACRYGWILFLFLFWMDFVCFLNTHYKRIRFILNNYYEQTVNR